MSLVLIIVILVLLFGGLALTQKAMAKAYGGQPSARDTIVAAATYC